MALPHTSTHFAYNLQLLCSTIITLITVLIYNIWDGKMRCNEKPATKISNIKKSEMNHQLKGLICKRVAKDDKATHSCKYTLCAYEENSFSINM